MFMSNKLKGKYLTKDFSLLFPEFLLTEGEAIPNNSSQIFNKKLSLYVAELIFILNEFFDKLGACHRHFNGSNAVANNHIMAAIKFFECLESIPLLTIALQDIQCRIC